MSKRKPATILKSAPQGLDPIGREMDRLIELRLSGAINKVEYERDMAALRKARAQER